MEQMLQCQDCACIKMLLSACRAEIEKLVEIVFTISLYSCVALVQVSACLLLLNVSYLPVCAAIMRSTLR